MTLVTRLSIDGETFERPTWEDVQRAIVSLDASARTLVSISLGGSDRHMAIGGGAAGLCVVYTTEDNLNFWNLEDRTKSNTRKILMEIGGQEGDFREDQCVPKAWALAAAREYFEHGTRASDLPWSPG